MENKTISNLIGMFDKKPSTSLSNNNLSSITSSNLQTSNTSHNNPTPHHSQSLQDSVVMRARNMEQKNKPPYQKQNTSSYSIPKISLNDPFQEEYTYLTPVTIPHSIFNPTFCEAFIIVSFPLTNGEPIPSSTSSPPPCNHFLCSKLPAMKPAILFNYPENPPNIELINSINVFS